MRRQLAERILQVIRIIYKHLLGCFAVSRLDSCILFLFQLTVAESNLDTSTGRLLCAICFQNFYISEEISLSKYHYAERNFPQSVLAVCELLKVVARYTPNECEAYNMTCGQDKAHIDIGVKY